MNCGCSPTGSTESSIASSSKMSPPLEPSICAPKLGHPALAMALDASVVFGEKPKSLGPVGIVRKSAGGLPDANLVTSWCERPGCSSCPVMPDETVLLVMFEEACAAAAKAPGSAGECEQVLQGWRRSSTPSVLCQVLQQCLSILPANADSYHDLLPLRNGLFLLQRFCHR